MISLSKCVGAVVCSIGLFCSAATVHAERSAESAVITTLTVSKAIGNFVFIRVNPAPSGSSQCHTNPSWHYTLSLDDAAGKSMYAILLTAAASKQPVSVAGSENLCAEFGGVDSLRAVGGVY